MKQKIYLIDGNSFCYRAFYAIQGLITSKGQPTNAIYGVLTMIRKLIEEDKPDLIGVCFDVKGPTFRHEQYKEYKAQRKPMPEDLRSQMPLIKEMIAAYNIPMFEMEGFEADDLLGTLAVKASKEKYKVYVVSGDKDFLQLVTPSIFIYNPHKAGLIYDSKKVEERYQGLGPEKVLDLMALMGDAADNIPGVPKVGEKTAISLLNNFGSLDKIYEHVDDVKGEAVKKSLKENKKLAYMSRDLATIDTSAPIKVKFEDLKVKEPNQNKLVELYKKFEFRTLLKSVESTADAKSEDRDYILVDTEKKLKDLVSELEKAKKVSVDTETTSTEPTQASLVGFSFSFKDLQAYYVPCSHPEHKGEGLPREQVIEALRPILENEKIKKVGQNIKYDWIVILKHGVEMKGLSFDTMIASYLINPAKPNHNLDEISMNYLGVRKIPTKGLLGSGKSSVTMDEVPLKQVYEYACEDADCVFRIEKKIKKILKENEGEDLLNDLELPLSVVLGRMEINGIKLDIDFLKKLSKKLDKELEQLTKQIYKHSGEEFNINSTKQLAEILFTKLELPVVKKTKTGFSTDVSVLEKLAAEHEVPKLILDYRGRAKLKSTYVDALPELVDKDDLVHTSFNQTIAATGRLSSSNPNLQNIPIKSDLGRQIRRAFIPRDKNRSLVSADYSQVELRLLAHFSEDPNLCKAFQEGVDVHKYTAALLFDVKEEDVTKEMRYSAKTVNFSIIYGKTAFGLSKDLNMSIPEADEFIKNYFKRYDHVKEYLESQKEKAQKNGFVTTILGRRAYFPEINSSNGMRRQFAERAAINAPLQGSAADLIKLAMLELDKKLLEKKYETKMILQVHDELVFDVPETELDEITKLVTEEMERALKLKVPLIVDLSVGKSWYEE